MHAFPVTIKKRTEISFEEELAADVLEIITVFSARLYGARSRKNKQLIDNLKKATDETFQGDDRVNDSKRKHSF
jgi:putative resolvase